MTEIKAFISCETFNNVGRLNGNVLNSFQNSVDTDIKGCSTAGSAEVEPPRTWLKVR